MKKNNERLQHALHNEAACQYMNLHGNYPDWVITTAFYAALHFVTYKIFPFHITTLDGKTKINFTCLEDYYKFKNYKNITKHSALSDLVTEKCNEIGADYDMLLDASKNARYISYQHDKLISDRAIRLMEKIAKYCKK